LEFKNLVGEMIPLKRHIISLDKTGTPSTKTLNTRINKPRSSTRLIIGSIETVLACCAVVRVVCIVQDELYI
jgi:hypothetical protein